MYHSCVTLGYREGNAAPAFVPNRKQTHKRVEVEEARRQRGGGKEGKKSRQDWRMRRRSEGKDVSV